MARKIKYKPVSKELEHIAKPIFNSATRASVGLDQAVGEYYFINIEQLFPFENQARKKFNTEDIEKLADSIKEYGIRQPLSVIKNPAGQYEVISGERRLRAAKLAGLYKVPCIVMKENKDADAVALIENIHRKDLHPIELGSVYKKLVDTEVFENQDKLGQAISVGKSKVSEYIKLAQLPEEIKQKVLDNNINSREKLRSLIKAYDNNDVTKMRLISGLTTKQQKNFSVIRILSSEGEINVQNSGVLKLSKEGKKQVRVELEKLIKQM